MRIFKKINKSNIKNKLKTNDKNIKIIKFLLLIGKIHCLVSLPHVTFLTAPRDGSTTYGT